MSASVQRTLDVARSQIGVAEPGWDDAPGTQVTKYGRWYAAWSGMPAYADTYWCAMFTSWVLAVAGFTPAEAGRYGNCRPYIRWWKAQGRWGTTPQPGAVVYYDWDGGGADHTGFVEAVRADGRIVTIEGNATSPGTRDAVKRMVRGAAIVGYGYPPYAAPPRPTAAAAAAAGAAPLAMAGGSRRGYPTMTRGFGGPEDTLGDQRWWVAQWLRALAVHSPGYYSVLRRDPHGAAEIARLEIGTVALDVAHRIGEQVYGRKLEWRGAIGPQLWSLYPPVK